jgi:hypothetical protein
MLDACVTPSILLVAKAAAAAAVGIGANSQ